MLYLRLHNKACALRLVVQELFYLIFIVNVACTGARLFSIEMENLTHYYCPHSSSHRMVCSMFRMSLDSLRHLHRAFSIKQCVTYFLAISMIISYLNIGSVTDGFENISSQYLH
jgi:hypothetical protein